MAGEELPDADGPPDGYIAPFWVYAVEDFDHREPEWNVGQFGAFTSREEAERLLKRLESEGVTGLRINMLPVHERYEDYEYDR